MLSLPETQVWWVKVLLSWVETRERDRDRTIVMTLKRSLDQYHRTGTGTGRGGVVPPASGITISQKDDIRRGQSSGRKAGSFQQLISNESSDEGRCQLARPALHRPPLLPSLALLLLPQPHGHSHVQQNRLERISVHPPLVAACCSVPGQDELVHLTAP